VADTIAYEIVTGIRADPLRTRRSSSTARRVWAACSRACDAGAESREERLHAEGRCGTPRNEELALARLHGVHDSLRDQLGLDDRPTEERALEHRAAAGTLRSRRSLAGRCALELRAASSPVSERENASCACFEDAYGPAGANATTPATETTLTTCEPLAPGIERPDTPDAAR
jgi:hypothetical protein